MKRTLPLYFFICMLSGGTFVFHHSLVSFYYQASARRTHLTPNRPAQKTSFESFRPTSQTRLSQPGPAQTTPNTERRTFSNFLNKLSPYAAGFFAHKQPNHEKINALFKSITLNGIEGRLTLEDIQHIPKEHLNQSITYQEGNKHIGSNETFLKSVIINTAGYPQETQAALINALLDAGADPLANPPAEADRAYNPAYEGSPLSLAIENLNVGAVQALINPERWLYTAPEEMPNLISSPSSDSPTLLAFLIKQLHHTYQELKKAQLLSSIRENVVRESPHQRTFATLSQKAGKLIALIQLLENSPIREQQERSGLHGYSALHKQREAENSAALHALFQKR